MTSFPFLTALIVLPLVGALVLWLLPKKSAGLAKPIAFVISLISLGLGIAMALNFNTASAGQYQFSETYAWIPQFGISYAVGINGVGLLMVLLALVLTPVVILAAWKEQEDDNRARHYLAIILTVATSMVAIFAARDLFLFYFVFEAMLIPIYFLIGMFGGAARKAAAVKFLLFSLAGGLIMLVGVIALYMAGPGGDQGFLIDNLVGADLSVTAERLIFLSFFVAFAIKAPMWPVHSWLPDAAQQAPVGTSTLLVGVLDKVGTFGMLVLCLPLFPNASAWAAPAVIALAIVSIIFGAILAIGQTDLLRFIAYTSVSHFGFIVLGIFAFDQTTTSGAAFYMLNHGLSTGALFLIAGFMIARRGSQKIADFGGWQRVTPVLAGVFLVSGLAAIGLPGLSPFISEFMVIVGSFKVNAVYGSFAALGVILAAVYFLNVYQKTMTGPVPTDEYATTADLSGREKLVVVPLIGLMLFLGFYPKPALDLTAGPAEEAVELMQSADAAAEDSAMALSASLTAGEDK